MLKMERAQVDRLRGVVVPEAKEPAPVATSLDAGQMAHMQSALNQQAANLARTTELLAASVAPVAKKMTSIIHRDSDGHMVRIETTIERI